MSPPVKHGAVGHGSGRGTQKQQPSKAYLASLKNIKMRDTKAVLPLELISYVLDMLPVPDLLRFARASRRMQDMVYEDSRWIQRLRLMGLWNEAQARRHFEESMRRNSRHALEPGDSSGPKSAISHAKAKSNELTSNETLFDADSASRNGDISSRMPAKGPAKVTIITLNTSPQELAGNDSSEALLILDSVASIRGRAREEFGKVYGALAPLYEEITTTPSLLEAKAFEAYDPEQQAKLLHNLRVFSLCDVTQGSATRHAALASAMDSFEQTAVREFTEGYAARDYDGRMRVFAHVLVTLGRGIAAVDAFVQRNPLLKQKDQFGHPLACLVASSSQHVDLTQSQSFYHAISRSLDEQVAIIERVFPPTIDVMMPLMGRIADEIVSEYVTTLFDEARKTSLDSYVRIVPGVFEQTVLFADSLYPAAGSEHDFKVRAVQTMIKCFEPHVGPYLREEVDRLKTRSILAVESWEKQYSAQEASTESFFMSNVNRQAAKRDFLASFKGVLMMPVNVLPGISSSKKQSSDTPNGSVTPTPSMAAEGMLDRPSTPRDVPKTELAAKAAIMNSRLEGIGSLFSIEVALSLIHLARASIERAALLVPIGGRNGYYAREQCQAIFIHLLDILGHRHVRSGFDTAVLHLSNYKAREVNEHTPSGVRPLVTFLELVNVGDLIQQMIDVFYVQQLVGKQLTDRDDFLDLSVKAKKKFEQMLDERVAAGLNKGIDVLMDEVDFICATEQAPTDFRPGNWSEKQQQHAPVMDIGPTKAARRVVDLVSSHTGMLVGSTDKNMLDVFNQEVGLRLFTSICKHLKRQRFSTDGAIILISDTNHYFDFVATLKNKVLLQYFKALRELSQIFLIDGRDAKELAAIIADSERYQGIFRVEEVLEFAERRADWYTIKNDVEKAMFGIGCNVM